jgi:hypothetical protein
MKKDAPRSSSMMKKWHNDGVSGKTCIKLEQCIKYLYNASNKQHASLPVGRGARRGGDLKAAQVEELKEVGDLKAVEAEGLKSSSNVGSFVN